MMLTGALHFLLIALVTLPVAGGIPLAILAYFYIRKDSRKLVIPAVHVVESTP